MEKKVQELLQNHRVSVLGILQVDNVIHSAALHFAHSENPIRFYFCTNKNSRKCASLLSGGEQNASLVIGTDEDAFETFQAEGKVQIVSKEDFEVGWEVYGAKFPNRINWKSDDSMVLLCFAPSWWRYVDMKIKPPIVVEKTDV